MTGTALHVPRHRHSPRVRRLAKEAGIDDLDAIEGTGPNGRVRPGDITDIRAQPVTFIAELDLATVPNSIEDRRAVVAAVAYAVLRAVRRHQPITEIEIRGGENRILIPRAHDLTRAAITDRLRIPGTAAASGSAPIMITDQSTSGGGLRVVPPRLGCLINAVIGPTAVRPTTHPGPVGLPSIEFHPTALLAFSTNNRRLGEAVLVALTSGIGSG